MSKLQRYIVAAVITAVVVFLVWYFSNVVTYILIAAVLAIIGKPLTDLLTGLHLGRSKIRIPKAVAALLTLIVIWLVVVGLFWLFVPILFQKLNQFSSLNISQIVASFQGPLVSLEHMIEKVFSIPDNEFSLADAIRVRQSEGMDAEGVHGMLRQWVHRRYVTIVTNDNYSKLKYRKDGKVVKPDKSNA